MSRGIYHTGYFGNFGPIVVIFVTYSRLKAPTFTYTYCLLTILYIFNTNSIFLLTFAFLLVLLNDKIASISVDKSILTLVYP